jgi:hypothetical protein
MTVCAMFAARLCYGKALKRNCSQQRMRLSPQVLAVPKGLHSSEKRMHRLKQILAEPRMSLAI